MRWRSEWRAMRIEGTLRGYVSGRYPIPPMRGMRDAAAGYGSGPPLECTSGACEAGVSVSLGLAMRAAEGRG
jgi:hypothetical protein